MGKDRRNPAWRTPAAKDRRLTNIAICIPARNEAEDLPRLFAALEQLAPVGLGDVAVCVLLDGCDDASAALVAGYRARSRHRVSVEQVATAGANAGRARHLAMTMGLEALGGGEGLLLTTDADSRPAATWLSAMVAALGHADLVAGRIVRSGDYPNALQDRIERYYDALFALRRRLDPVPWEAAVTHHHIGGANMGIRASAYRAVGGFAAVASGEDARLVDEAARAGLRVRREAASVVHTSDRRIGRAVVGLATTLRHLDDADEGGVEVAHPADAAWQYRAHAIARAAFAVDDLDTVAAAIGVTRDHALGVARDCPNGEAFAMRIVPVAPGGMRSVALPVAEGELALLLDARCAA